MKIIGIDPGTKITGYGIILSKENKNSVIDYGCIRPSPQMKLSDRYNVIYNSITELIKKNQPEVLVVETQYVSKNPQSAIKLGMARGSIIVAAKQQGLPIFEYTPSKTKLAVVGHGGASKPQVQEMVKLQLALSSIPQPEDAADALALALCHAFATRQSLTVPCEV